MPEIFPPTDRYMTAAGTSPIYQATTTATVNNTIWPDWVSAQFLPTGTGYAGYVDGLYAQSYTTWYVWNTINTGTTPVYVSSVQPIPDPVVSVHDPASVAILSQTRARRQMIYNNRLRAIEVRKNVAKRKADALLVSQLSAEQREEYDEHNYFHVVTKDGLRKYRIDYGMAGNVHLVECSGEISMASGATYGQMSIARGATFCAHIPDSMIPLADHMLAQKLMIEADEAAFLELANVSY